MKQKTFVYRDTEYTDKLRSTIVKEFGTVLWYWRHPWFRIAFCTTVLFTNVIMNCADPMVHSHKETSIPFAGSMFNLIFRFWRYDLWTLYRIFLILVWFILGPILGYHWFHHKFLRNCLKLSCFGYGKQCKNKYKGTWFSMVIFTCFWGIPIVYAWNLVVPKDRGLTDNLGFSEYLFGQICGVICWVADLFTWFMCVDSMAQDRTKYKTWCPSFRACWKGKVRLYGVWIPIILTTILNIILLFWEGLLIPKMDYVIIFHDELSRCLGAAFVFVLNLFIITQDWEFPNFDTRLSVEIKVTGLDIKAINTESCCNGCCRCCIDYCAFEVTGRWMNYTPMIFTMLLDLAYFYSLFFYAPKDYSQYVGPDDYVWNLPDWQTANTKNLHLSYAVRKNEGDEQLNAKFLDYPMWALLCAAIPFLLGLITFFIMFKFLNKYQLTESEIEYLDYTSQLSRTYRKFDEPNELSVELETEEAPSKDLIGPGGSKQPIELDRARTEFNTDLGLKSKFQILNERFDVMNLNSKKENEDRNETGSVVVACG